MEVVYKEQQVGVIPITIFGLSTIGMLYLGYLFGYNIIFVLLTIFFFVVTVVYSNMLVTVTEEFITIRIGWVLQQQIPMAEVSGLDNHDTALLSDWGIRPLGKGWLYSIAGSTAIEIHMRDGTMFVVGTNTPEKLLNSIKEAKKERISVGLAPVS